MSEDNESEQDKTEFLPESFPDQAEPVKKTTRKRVSKKTDPEEGEVKKTRKPRKKATEKAESEEDAVVDAVNIETAEKDVSDEDVFKGGESISFDPDEESVKNTDEEKPSSEMQEGNVPSGAGKRDLRQIILARRGNGGGDSSNEAVAGQNKEKETNPEEKAVQENASSVPARNEDTPNNGNNKKFDRKDWGDRRQHTDKNPQNQGNKVHQKSSSQKPFEKNKGKEKGPKFRSKGFGLDGEQNLDIGDLPYYGLFAQQEELEMLASTLCSSNTEPLLYNHIYTAPIKELLAWAQMKQLQLGGSPGRGQLIDGIVQLAANEQQELRATGVLDIVEDGFGLLVFQSDSYAQKSRSVYVDRSFIKRYGLQRGHILTVQIHPKREHCTCPFCIRVIDVMGKDLTSLEGVTPFQELTPYYPLDRIRLETDGKGGWDNISMRIVDMLSPVGLGQRGLIVAPPRVGKTILLQGIANAIQSNYPNVHLIVLLIDERPEEVTDFKRQVKGEVICSTFDESAESHCHAAELVIEKARRMVEQGQHVVILLDSITRLARAYNTLSPNSGKILSGGVEANALQKPKRFFGSARNIEGGGSLTILGTALVETGSKMDEVIFEEFKGTGNMELHLDRELADKRIFPAINMDKSGTRKEELLYHKDEMNKIYSLRRAMKGVPSTDAMELLIQRVRKTQTNAEFLISMNR